MFIKRGEIKTIPLDVLHNPDFSSGNYDYIKSIDLKLASKEAVVKDGQTPAFDLESEVREHPDFLYIKCFAIKADETNDNGDWFGVEELRKATSSFVGVPCFSNHQNNDVEKAKGKVIHAWYDDEKNGIMIIARIDAVAYPHLARGIKESYIVSTSMGCQVNHSICSICHNCASRPENYCTHIKEQKNKVLSGKTECIYKKNGSGKCPLCGCDENEQKTLEYNNIDAHEKNFDLKFIENSFVVSPACSGCGVSEVIDTSKFLKKVAEINKILPSLLKVASTQPLSCSDQSCMTLVNESDVKVFEQALESINKIASSIKELERVSRLEKQTRSVEIKLNLLNKHAGQQEISDLKSAIDLISNVSKKIIDQRDNVDLEFLEDLIEALSKLQECTNELTQMGYGNLPEEGAVPEVPGQPAAPTPTPTPTPTPLGGMPGAGASKVQTGPAEGGIGTVTSPAVACIKLPFVKKARKNVTIPLRMSQRKKKDLDLN